MRTALRVAMLLCVLLPACASPSTPSGASATEDKPSTRPATPEEGKAGSGAEEPKWKGPNFTVETFDGTRFELAANAGRPVVINFWESW